MLAVRRRQRGRGTRCVNKEDEVAQDHHCDTSQDQLRDNDKQQDKEVEVDAGIEVEVVVM